MPYYRLPAAYLLTLAVSFAAGETFADCCAGHRGNYLAYGGGLRHTGPARPFQGTANPRYANTDRIGGPMAPLGTHHFAPPHPVTPNPVTQNQVVPNQFTRRPFVNMAALRQTAELQTNRYFASNGQPASDAELLTAEPVESLVDRPSDTDRDAWQSAYPGEIAPAERLESAPQESGSRRGPQSGEGLRTDRDHQTANCKAIATPAPPVRPSARLGPAASFVSLSTLQSGSLLPQSLATPANVTGRRVR